MATRFEALASTEGSPIKISRGMATSDPPPAIVLMNPAKNPVASKSSTSVQAIEWNFGEDKALCILY
jgi:hypothetical protein